MLDGNVLSLGAGGLSQVAGGEVGDAVRSAHLLLPHLPGEAPGTGAGGLAGGAILLAVVVRRANLVEAGF